nr:aspartyl protease family protein At5g10770-like [Ziziphus jujuba var. spinosa]
MIKLDLENKKRLKVVDKHGPCFQLHKNKTSKAPTPAEILQQDEYRVNSIQSHLSKNSIETDATTIPAESGETIGSGNYIVTVGLGTPKRDLSLIFDTGSDVTWTQCKTQSCSSPASPCQYGVRYGDRSYTIGDFGKERITINQSDVFDNFLFGCGHNNQGLFSGAAGLLALGRGELSFVEQTAQKYNRIFSYCLPPTSSSSGFLSFGKADKVSGVVNYVQLSSASLSNSFYGLQLEGISINERRVSVISSSGTIIDSGTVITRLPASTYRALRYEFQQQMKQYILIKSPVSLLDTCYDFSGNDNVEIPKLSLLFSGGTTVELDSTGVFYALSESQFCLAFAGNSDNTEIAILGNVQQRRLEVVYDIGGQRVGFRSAAC